MYSPSLALYRNGSSPQRAACLGAERHSRARGFEYLANSIDSPVNLEGSSTQESCVAMRAVPHSGMPNLQIAVLTALSAQFFAGLNLPAAPDTTDYGQKATASLRNGADKQRLLQAIALNVATTAELKPADWHDIDIVTAIIGRGDAFEFSDLVVALLHNVTDEALTDWRTRALMMRALTDRRMNFAPEILARVFSHEVFVSEFTSPRNVLVGSVMRFISDNRENDLFPTVMREALDRADAVLCDGIRVGIGEKVSEAKASIIVYEALAAIPDGVWENPLARRAAREALATLPEAERKRLIGRFGLGELRSNTEPSTTAPWPNPGLERYQAGVRERLLALVDSNPRQVMRDLGTADISDPDICSAVAKILERDFESLRELRRVDIDASPRMLEVLLASVSLAENRQLIANLVLGDITALADWPEVVTRVPEIAHVTRVKLNQLLFQRARHEGPFSGGEDPFSAPHSSYAGSFERFRHHCRNVPDLLMLPHPMTFRPTAAEVLWNPRVYLEVTEYQRHPQLLDAWETANRVADLLNIPTFNQFDNFRALVRGRYTYSDSQMRARLEGLLGREYFAGAEGDNRPVALILFPSPRADHRERFLVTRVDEAPQFDIVDYATSYYATIYAHLGWDSAGIATIRDIALRAGRRLEEVTYYAHSNKDGIELRQFGRLGAASVGDSNFGPEDQPLIETLSGVVAQHVRIRLLGCNTATPPSDGVPSLLDTFARTLPENEIVGVSGRADYWVEYDREGRMTEVHAGSYRGPAAIVTLRPQNGRTERQAEDWGSEQISDRQLAQLRRLQGGVVLAGFSALGFAARRRR